MLALVYFVKHYRHYLLGRSFVIRTDHQSLRWLQNFRDPEGQIARWQEILQEYDFTCQHRPGKQHANADAMSRRPTRNHGDCPSCSLQYVTIVNAQSMDTGRWQHVQATDPETSLIYNRLKDNGDRPTSKEMEGASYETRCLWSLWDQVVLANGVLFFHYGPNYTRRIVVPQSMVSEVLGELHRDLGHAGINKMVFAAKQRFWWPHLYRDVRNFCSSCERCGSFKNPSTPHRAPLQPMSAGFPNELVGVDIMGPLPETPRGNRYVLVLVDYFTKWCEAVPLAQIDATTVANAIVNEWICNWGAPNQLHSDRGSNFESSLILELCRALGIDKTRTTAYHPQGNGQVERTNRSLKALLKSFIDRNVSDWDAVLPKCLLAYRSSVHSSTGQTPYFLWTGREARLPSDLRLPLVQQPRPSVTEYVCRLLDTIRNAHQEARIQLQSSHRYQKEYYDKKVFGTPLNVGELVWLHNATPNPGVPAKLHKEWKGPFEVERLLSDSTCMIRDPRTNSRPIVVHFNRLKPYIRTHSRETESEEVPLDVALELEVPVEGGQGRAPGTVLEEEGSCVMRNRD